MINNVVLSNLNILFLIYLLANSHSKQFINKSLKMRLKQCSIENATKIVTRIPVNNIIPKQHIIQKQAQSLYNDGLYKTLQYISDIHLERRTEFPKIPIVSSNVALLGDIGNPFTDIYEDFFRYVSDKCDRVFFVPGNHEYWHHKQSEEKVCDKLKIMCDKLKNVEYLSNTHTKLFDYDILGTTLWVPWYKRNYDISVGWLSDNIASMHDKKIIVLSHYLPSYKLIVPKYWTKEYKSLQQQYASNLEHLMKPNVKFWLCGHSHSTNNSFINGTYCAINAYGHYKCKEDIDTISCIDLNDVNFSSCDKK